MFKHIFSCLLGCFIFFFVACAKEDFIDEVTEAAPFVPWRPAEEIILDCPWLSQQFAEVTEENPSTLNCGPTSVVMAAACIDGFTPETQDIVDVITWMEENIDDYNYGSVTNALQLSDTMSWYYDITARPFKDSYEPLSLQDIYGALEDSDPTLVFTSWQGDNETDVMTSGSAHAMLIVGMNQKYVVVNDPGPWDADFGAYHEYTIESFQQRWLSDAGVRFLVE